MSSAKEAIETVTVEFPAGTRAALEEVAAENFTTPQVLLSRYILHGIEQTKLGRKFDLAYQGSKDSQAD